MPQLSLLVPSLFRISRNQEGWSKSRTYDLTAGAAITMLPAQSRAPTVQREWARMLRIWEETSQRFRINECGCNSTSKEWDLKSSIDHCSLPTSVWWMDVRYERKNKTKGERFRGLRSNFSTSASCRVNFGWQHDLTCNYRVWLQDCLKLPK